MVIQLEKEGSKDPQTDRAENNQSRKQSQSITFLGGETKHEDAYNPKGSRPRKTSAISGSFCISSHGRLLDMRTKSCSPLLRTP